jgi:adenylyltransferase/sulfurtransferase
VLEIMDNDDVPLDRYVRQMRFPALGEAGQRRLLQSRAMICGCGALGSTAANLLVRAGVGAVRIVDRDFVELSNLQRQTLFDQRDAREGLPKAVAAAEKLRQINSSVAVEAIVADIDGTNVERFCEGVDVIVDGTDNFETRFLINDAAVRRRLPWVYGGCVGAEGRTMTIVPGQTPCLRCLMPDCPAPGSTPTCDTAGILGPAVGVIAAIEAMEALKILSGQIEAISRSLTVVDLWDCRIRHVDVSSLREQVDCPACNRGEFPWLAGQGGSRTAVLCGRNAVQLTPSGSGISLDELAQRLQGVGRVTRNQFLVRLAVESYELTIFADGRAIVGGTDDVATARSLYAKYVGG